MMYSYPFFSFPHFGKYTRYYSSKPPIVRQPTKNNVYASFPYTKSNNVYTSAPYTKSNNVNDSSLHKNVNCEPIKESFGKEKSSLKKAPAGFSFLNNFLHQEDRADEEELFNLFGLKLYNDDILLLGLIFFLYKEDVKDQYLFFALILLLLS